jgi:hypothetical protein
MVKDFLNTIPKNTVLFCTLHETDADIDAAKKYCNDNELTFNEVSIKIRYAEKQDEKNVVVVVKK